MHDASINMTMQWGDLEEEEEQEEEEMEEKQLESNI